MSKDAKSDKELAVQIKNGNITAFDEVYEKYSRRLYSFVFGIIKSEKDSEDIVQEVFIKVWHKRDKINEYLSFQSYLFTIAYNTTISLLRKKINESDYISHIKSVQLPSETISDKVEIEFVELKEKLKNTIEKLPERQREVYSYSRDEDLSYKEIAEKLGISVNTVENHMAKALKFIRENMSDSTFLAAFFCAIFIY